MRRFGRLSGLGVLFLVGCSGAAPAPTAPPRAAPIEKEPLEKADLSPVTAPPEVFLVGRLKRPGPIADVLGKWAGLPVSPRELLGKEMHGLDSVIAWDAPIELAVALPGGGRRHDVRAVVSVGLNSLGGMLSAVRDRGFSPERILPEVFGFQGPSGLRCVIGPSLGGANARLVCGERSAGVEELFAYATRGLPNENLGNRDLELELRAEPLRHRFSSEIAGTRLFAGFLLRQLEMDSPRFDRVLADAAYGVADELVLEVEDTDSFRVGGMLDETNKNLSLDIAWKFRSSHSWVANVVSDLARRAGPPPPAFARLPGDATSAGYTVDLETSRFAPVRTALTDLVDAYLEYEKLGKNPREHARRLFARVLGLTAASVQSKGNLAAGKKVSDTERKLGWRLTRVELPLAEINLILEDLHALISDQVLWKTLAKRFDLDPKALPKSELGPLKGKGIPDGARSLVVTIPTGLTEQIQKNAAPRFKVETKQPVRIVFAAAPDGKTATVFVVTSDKKDASERLRAFSSDGGRRLGDRGDLAALKASHALHAEFFTLLGLFDSLPPASVEKMGALLPNHGETPIISSYTATAGPPLVLSASLTIPAGAFADFPGAATSFADTHF